MDKDRSLRQRLQSTVLEASTPAGKAYNAVIFGAILLSVLAHTAGTRPLGSAALRHTNVPWIDLVQNVCLAVFAADFVLHLVLVEKPRRYCSASPDWSTPRRSCFSSRRCAVSCCSGSSSAASCGCSSCSSSSMKPACWGGPAGCARTIGIFLFSSSCCRWCSATAFL